MSFHQRSYWSGSSKYDSTFICWRHTWSDLVYEYPWAKVPMISGYVIFVHFNDQIQVLLCNEDTLNSQALSCTKHSFRRYIKRKPWFYRLLVSWKTSPTKLSSGKERTFLYSAVFRTEERGHLNIFSCN